MFYVPGCERRSIMNPQPTTAKRSLQCWSCLLAIAHVTELLHSGARYETRPLINSIDQISLFDGLCVVPCLLWRSNRYFCACIWAVINANLGPSIRRYSFKKHFIWETLRTFSARGAICLGYNSCELGAFEKALWCEKRDVTVMQYFLLTCS